MSRFWAAGNSLESDSDSGDESEEEQQITRPAAPSGKFGANFDESDSESEDEVRVVKSSTDRALDAIRERVDKIRNHRKNSNWSAIQDDFEEVNRMIERSKILIMKTGIPKFYIKMLADIEDFLNITLKDKEGMKKMKKTVAHAVNRMKLNVGKHNKKYETEIADYRAHPENYDEVEEPDDESDDEDSEDDDEDSEDDDESDDEPKAKSSPAKKVVSRFGSASDDDSDEDSLFGDESDDESDESEDDRGELKGRARWVKKETTKAPTKKVINKATDDKKASAKAASKAANLRLAEGEAGKKAKIAIEIYDDIKEDELDQKVKELIASRGRKGTDPREMLRKLEMLSKASRRFGPRKEIPVLMHLVSAMYDSHRSIDDYMDLQQWRTCFRCLMRIAQLLDKHRSIVLGTIPTEDVTDLVISPLIRAKKEGDVDAEDDEVKADDEKGPLKAVGTLDSFLSRLEDEYTKSLQQINPHTQDYVVRLSDEASLVELAEALFSYCRRVGDNKAASLMALLHVERIYYKHDTVAAAVQKSHLFNKKWGSYSDIHPAATGKIASSISKTRDAKFEHPASFLGNPSVEVPSFDSSAKLEELCHFVFKHGDERTKTRALLCSVYHHALHDRYYRARDLFLMSHIQDTIERVDTKTQILFNRAVVTLGLSAFRLGLIQKAHDCLSPICSGRVKELLAQGQARWYEKDPEQEKVERRRQMPYHMHINPDLLEGCHMISAMFLELPNMTRSLLGSAAQQPAAVISRSFRKYMTQYSRQVFTGPPENIREHVLASAKALMAGEWEKACDYILKLEVWNLIPGDGGDKVKVMLRERMREEAVRTFLCTYGSHYESLSLVYLCQMFGMDEVTIRRITSRMIFNKEISAAWEHPADTLVLYSVDYTNVQSLSQLVADKVALLVESNEKLLDPLVNVYSYKDDWGGHRGSGPGDRKQGSSGAGWTGGSGQGQGGSGEQAGGERRRQVGWKSKPYLMRQGGRGSGAGGRGGRSGGRGWSGANGASGSNSRSMGNQGQQSTDNVASNRLASSEHIATANRSWGAPN